MKKSSLFLIICGLLWSCDSLFEKTISFDDIQEEQLAITAILSDQDSIHQVFLTRTISATASPNYDTIKTASITLENNSTIHAFQYNDQSGFYESDAPIDIKPNEEWRLVAETSDFEPIRVAQLSPTSPSTIHIDTSMFVRLEDSTFLETGSLSITIKDVPNTDNYYIVELLGSGIGTNFETFREDTAKVMNLFISTNSSILDYSDDRRIYFTDENRAGQDLKIQLDYWSTLDAMRELELKVTSTTREGYLYSLTSDKFKNTRNRPFAEPVALFSNIQGGVGVFSLSRIQYLGI